MRAEGVEESLTENGYTSSSAALQGDVSRVCPRSADACVGGLAVYMLGVGTQQALRSESNPDPSAILRDPAWTRCLSGAQRVGASDGCRLRADVRPTGHNSSEVVSTYYLTHAT